MKHIYYIHVCITNMKTKGEYLGEFEELILLTVASLLDDAYGVSVMKYIKQETNRAVNISAVHEGLKRLQRKGFIESRLGGATKVRGGRRKRYFILTDFGKSGLEEIMMLKLQLYRKVPNFNLKLTYEKSSS